MIGWTEYLVIFLVVLLLFGAKRIPEIARSLGKASREFKNARDEISAPPRDVEDSDKQDPKA
ncbi:MAG: twin-arginine translocase TatA/TatE family subunit [Lentisphaeria bacterium]|nr:twin-arginine translocase TatA/TatE family subunit [Lentisphaeria bacterium]